MIGVAIALGVLVAAGAVLLVALPFLREPVADDDRLDAPSAGGAPARTLSRGADRALAALKELEFDHRTGKIGDEDYRSQLGPLRRSAAAALRAIDRYGAEMTAFEVPDLPAEPAPPPDEGTPPTPATVPEPYPPPDEADLPARPPAGVTARRGESSAHAASRARVSRCARGRDAGVRRRLDEEAANRLSDLLVAGEARRAEAARAGAPERGRRLHLPDPHARGQGGGCLAQALDDGGRSLAASAPAECVERSLPRADEEVRVPEAAVRGVGQGAEHETRRHLRVRRDIDARRVPRLEQPCKPPSTRCST